MNKRKKDVLYILILIMLFVIFTIGCNNIGDDSPSPIISENDVPPTFTIQESPSEELPSTAELNTPENTPKNKLILENVNMKTALETLFNLSIEDINKIIAYLPELNEERIIVNDEYTPKASNHFIILSELIVDCYEIQEIPEIDDNHYINLYIDDKNTDIEAIAHIFNLYSNEDHILEMYGNEQYSTVYVHNDRSKYMLVIKNNIFSQFTILFMTPIQYSYPVD